MYKLFESYMKLAWKVKGVIVKDTKSDQLNFEPVAFRFELTGEFNNLNLYSIGMDLKKFCCRVSYSVGQNDCGCYYLGNTCFEHGFKLG